MSWSRLPSERICVCFFSTANYHEYLNSGFTRFSDYSTIFNGNVVSAAKAVVCPLDAEDVSKYDIFPEHLCYLPTLTNLLLPRIVLFCAKHSLSPSIKAGGYGTAGWAIGGDIIIDLSKMVDVDIEPPKEDGSFTSLRHVASVNSKGKNSVKDSPASSGKRRREEDINLRHYDLASHAVASFLHGPPLSTTAPQRDGPPPSVRRRLDLPSQSSSSSSVSPVPPEIVGQSFSSSSNSTSGDSRRSREQSFSTADTSPSPPSAVFDSGSASKSSNPFGYLDATTNYTPAPPPAVLQSTFISPPMLTSWGPSPSSIFANGPANFAQANIPAHAEPIHPHAYVTFGAGMRQKEIDTFTAKEKLEARYVTGSGDGIPYHVPL